MKRIICKVRFNSKLYDGAELKHSTSEHEVLVQMSALENELKLKELRKEYLSKGLLAYGEAMIDNHIYHWNNINELLSLVPNHSNIYVQDEIELSRLEAYFMTYCDVIRLHKERGNSKNIICHNTNCFTIYTEEKTFNVISIIGHLPGHLFLDDVREISTLIIENNLDYWIEKGKFTTASRRGNVEMKKYPLDKYDRTKTKFKVLAPVKDTIPETNRHYDKSKGEWWSEDTIKEKPKKKSPDVVIRDNIDLLLNGKTKYEKDRASKALAQFYFRLPDEIKENEHFKPFYENKINHITDMELVRSLPQSKVGGRTFLNEKYKQIFIDEQLLKEMNCDHMSEYDLKSCYPTLMTSELDWPSHRIIDDIIEHNPSGSRAKLSFERILEEISKGMGFVRFDRLVAEVKEGVFPYIPSGRSNIHKDARLFQPDTKVDVRNIYLPFFVVEQMFKDYHISDKTECRRITRHGSLDDKKKSYWSERIKQGLELREQGDKEAKRTMNMLAGLAQISKKLVNQTIREMKDGVVIERNLIDDSGHEIMTYKGRDNELLPSGMYLIWRARMEISRLLNQLGDRAIYSHTDSIHVFGDIEIESEPYFKWEKKREFNRAYYNAVSHYVAENTLDPAQNKIAMAGVAYEERSISAEEYARGIEVDAQTLMVDVGGIQMVNHKRHVGGQSDINFKGLTPEQIKVLQVKQFTQWNNERESSGLRKLTFDEYLKLNGTQS